MSDHYHHTIVVTANDQKEALRVRAKLIEIFDKVDRRLDVLVSPIVNSVRNGYSSFFVAPDGSGVGYDIDEFGDIAREKFAAWAKSEDAWRNYHYFDWVIVRYGDLERGSEIEDAHDNYGEDE